jgi:hypothetical protein
MHSFSVEATFEYVRGHQDQKTPFSELPLLANLNVEADRYAGTHRDLHGCNRPIIPLSATRPVALDIDGKTIHCGFKQVIRDAIHAPHLLEAMQIRYDWPDRILETIDWEAHRQALQGQSNRRTHFVKLCHDILPTGNVVCRHGQGLPSYCALCSTPDKDFAHVLCCPHPSRTKWHSDFIVNLRKKCHNLSTDQCLLDILLSGIESWLTQTPFDSSEFPSEYQILIREQTAIGWVHLFQGRITNSWQRMQQYHYSGLRPVKGRDGAFWSRSILAHIFLEWLLLWDARNKLVHGNDSVSRSQAIRELEILYSYRNQVLQRD